MATQKEILRYEADVKQALADLDDLQKKIGRVQDQADKSGKVDAAAMREAGLSAEKLLQQKEKLVGISQVLGSSLGSLAGPLGGMVEAFIALGPLAAGITAAFGALVLVVKEYNAEQQEAIKLTKELQQVRRGTAETEQGRLQNVVSATRGAGILTNVERIRRVFNQFAGFGTEAATEATIAELSGKNGLELLRERYGGEAGLGFLRQQAEFAGDDRRIQFANPAFRRQQEAFERLDERAQAAVNRLRDEEAFNLERAADVLNLPGVGVRRDEVLDRARRQRLTEPEARDELLRERRRAQQITRSRATLGEVLDIAREPASETTPSVFDALQGGPTVIFNVGQMTTSGTGPHAIKVPRPTAGASSRGP